MKTPWHLWAVGVVSLLWNAFGAVDFTMTATMNQGYLSGFSAEQIGYLMSFPLWAVVFWALGVWGAVLGSLLLLLRSRHAVLAFIFALIGLAGTTLYAQVLAPPAPEGLGGTGALVLTAVIALVTIALAWYSRRMAGSGVLA